MIFPMKSKKSNLPLAPFLSVALSGFLTLTSPLPAQDVERAWTEVIAIDNQIASAKGAERKVMEEQQSIQAEIQSLEEDKTWYNGWIFEMRLAKRNALLVGMADSLQRVRKIIADLTVERETAFFGFKQVYRETILKDEAAFSSSEKEQAIVLGRWLINQPGQAIDLPDYGAILQGPYEDPKIKRLVMADLQLVLQAKLALIDVLIHEQESEAILVNRLNEFHTDLGLEMNANLELAESSSENLFADKNAEGAATMDYHTTELTEKRTIINEQAANIAAPTGQNQLATIPETPLPAQAPALKDALSWLKLKQQAYRELLQHIQAELKP